MDDIIRIIKSLENSVLLIDGATETVEHKKKTNKQKKRCISWCYDGTYGCFIESTYGFSLFMRPVTSLLINAISGKGVMRAGKEQEGGILLLLALLLMMKAVGKGVKRVRKGYNNMSQMDEKF